MQINTMKTIAFHAADTDKLSYCDDWSDAITSHQLLSVESVNILGRCDMAKLKRRVQSADLIVLLHSINRTPRNITKFNPFKSILDSRKGPLVSFVGDEVNVPDAPMKQKIDFLRDLEADVIATQLPIDAGRWLYEECERSRVIALPPALNPFAFKPEIDCEGRPVDIGTISVKYPPFLGDDDRNRLFDFFLSNAKVAHFIKDIRYADAASGRLDRDGWAKFLNSCKGTIATEAGSDYLDRNDERIKEIQDYFEKQADPDKYYIDNESFIRKTYNKLPFSVQKYISKNKESLNKLMLNKLGTSSSLLYGDIPDQVLGEIFTQDKKCKEHSKAISSRHFDAIGTKTCQILFEGEYNGILIPDVHYLCLKKDFSNIDDVLERFSDFDSRSKIVDEAYEHIRNNHTYRHRVDYLADEIY